MPDFTGLLGTSASRLGNIQLAHIPADDTPTEPPIVKPRWDITPTTRWDHSTSTRWPATTSTRWPLD